MATDTQIAAMGRFMAKVNKDAPGGCWRWTAGSKNQRYGMFYEVATRAGAKQVLAHRFSYEVFVGPIPEGTEIDHLCRNTKCINPEHLEAVSHRENVHRGTSPMADNAKKTHCRNGHPYDDEHTYLYKGKRQCRPCRNAYSMKYMKTYRKKDKEIAS